MACVEPAPATLAYSEFLLATAATGDIGLVCAAMTPCMRLYAWLAWRWMRTQRDRTRKWVQTYADPGFEVLTTRLERLLDEQADEGSAVSVVHRWAMGLELAFFDAVLLPSA